MKNVTATACFVISILVSMMSNSTYAVTPFAPQDPVVANVPAEFGSLVRVPQSTGMYIATMNHKALFAAVTQSNAWKAIKNSEVARGMKKAYRRGRTRGYADYNEENPFSQFLKGYGDSVDNIIVNTAWDVAEQAFGNELFLYIDNDALALVNAGQNFQSEMVKIIDFQTMDDLEGQMSEEIAQKSVELFSKHFAGVECPTVIMGSRLDDPAGFRGLLELAKSGAEEGLKNLPPDLAFLQIAWEVVDQDDVYLMTVDFDFADLPLDKIVEESEDPVLARSIVDLLAEKRASIALGIVDDLLLFGFASDQDRLIQFGEGASLIDLPDLKRLREAVEKNETMVSVSYISKEFAKLSFSLDRVFASNRFMIKPVIMSSDDIPENEKEMWVTRIENDFDEFLIDLKMFRPVYGMQFGYTALNAEGINGYYSMQAKHPGLDGSKPLLLGSHAGPDTMAFLVQRPNNLQVHYGIGAKWAEKIYGYVKPMALRGTEVVETVELAADPVEVSPLVDETDTQEEIERKAIDAAERDAEELAQFETITAALETFFASCDRTTRETLIPAIEGNEAGLFVDMIRGPNPWHPEIPTSADPLPLPLPALIVGTSHSQNVIKAGEQYWQAVDQLYDAAKEFAPAGEGAKVPELVPPERIVNESGISFRWSLISEFGQVDPAVRMGTTISDNWLVINLFPAQAERLIQPQTNHLFGPATSTEPSLSVAFYDHRVMMQALRQWLDFSQTLAPEGQTMLDLSQYEAERDTLQFSEEQLRDALERIWTLGECWKGFSSRSYLQADAETVTEFWLKFEDIPETK